MRVQTDGIQAGGARPGGVRPGGIRAEGSVARQQRCQGPESLGNSLLGSKYFPPGKPEILFLHESKNVSPEEEVEDPCYHQLNKIYPSGLEYLPPEEGQLWPPDIPLGQ